MLTLDAPPLTCDSASTICVIEYRPGPHAASVSLTRKDTAPHTELFRTEPEPPSMGALSATVPSKSAGPRAVVDGDCVGVRVAAWERVSLCVREGDGVALGVCDGDGVPLAVGVPVGLGVRVSELERDWV